MLNQGVIQRYLMLRVQRSIILNGSSIISMKRPATTLYRMTPSCRMIGLSLNSIHIPGITLKKPPIWGLARFCMKSSELLRNSSYVACGI